MKGKSLTMKHLRGGVIALAALLAAVSCADGFESSEKFESSVKNASLKSPDAAGFKIELDVQRADGANCMRVSWPLVVGAGGYLCNVADITDESAPKEVVTDSIVDGVSVLFPYEDDTRYQISILTLGNKELNNTGAETATVTAYTTGGESVPVPSSNKDLGAFIAKYLADNAETLEAKRAEDPNFEVAFDLEAGAEYTIDTDINMGLLNTRIRNIVEDNRPKVSVNCPIVTGAGLKLKNINFDFSGSSAIALIALCKIGEDNQADFESITLENLGYKALGASFDGYMIEKSVVVQNCWIKNLPAALLHAQATPWSLKNVTVENCIVQMNNDGTALFEFNGAGNSLIKEHKISNSTIYSNDDINAFFINYPRQLDAHQILGGTSDSASSSIIFENSTLAKFSKKQMGNNSKDTKTGHHVIRNCIFYDCFRIYQIFGRSNTIRDAENNILDYITVSEDSNDTSRFGETESTGFSEPFGDIDFAKENAGLNFKVKGAISSTIGDPRWK